MLGNLTGQLFQRQRPRLGQRRAMIDKQRNRPVVERERCRVVEAEAALQVGLVDHPLRLQHVRQTGNGEKLAALASSIAVTRPGKVRCSVSA